MDFSSRRPLPISGRFASAYVLQLFMGDRLDFVHVKNTEELQKYTKIHSTPLMERDSPLVGLFII